MPIGPKGPPTKPGLSIRGRVIASTFRGVPYVRPWPGKRPLTPGSKRDQAARAFAAANRACKVTDAVFYGEHWAATRGTPLLPRDLMIAFMYGRAFALTLEDGRIIRSMAAMHDVSKSLDLIGNKQGTSLVRGEHYWETRENVGSVQGAMAGLSANKVGVNYSTDTAIAWDAIKWQMGNWIDLAAAPTKFIVPADVSAIRLSFMVVLTSVASGSLAAVYTMLNGSAGFPGFVGSRNTDTHTTRYLPGSSGPIPVNPGDELELFLVTPSDTNITIHASQTSFSIEALG